MSVKQGWVSACVTAAVMVAGAARAWAITYDLPFHEDFEPTPDHWNWTAEWICLLYTSPSPRDS